MTTVSVLPFSARNRSETDWIEEDFPTSARVALLHLLRDVVDRYYVSSWAVVAKELGRIARVVPSDYNPHLLESIKRARSDTERLLNQLGWDRVYDFCERLHTYLAQGTVVQRDGEEVSITLAQSQSFIADELQRLFDEEGLVYEFYSGSVQRRGKRHTVTQILRAQEVLADQRLNPARKHFSKSLRYFRDRKEPDYENAVKEAVCAVEAAAKELFPDSKAATLGEFAKWATNDKRLFAKTIGQTFVGLYAFRSSGEGVAHGATSGEAVTVELSEYVLGVAASQIIFLADLNKSVDEPPF